MKVLKNKIKLIIWDLDETFWTGTLSEGEITPIESNIELIKELTDRGIVNSISSKNNHEDVRRQLESLEIWDYFVFPQVSWNPKGQIIRDLIENMALRADNVLFIDDNVLNLNEALFFSPNLNVCLPEHIGSLADSEYFKGKEDFKHTRLLQYKNLEKKHVEFEQSNMSNIEFLKESNIKVEIKHNCIDELNRIHELVDRTNQLNFTKNRVSVEELRSQLDAANTISGYIKVVDKYGDYGISGFYLIKDDELEHFLFSCRTMNMYIESWVYQQIGAPGLNINGDVATKLDTAIDLSFINNDDVNNITKSEDRTPQIESGQTILMMGGCDLDQVVVYLNYDKLDTEFNYPNSLNINVHKDHSHLIQQFYDVKQETVELIKKLPVLDVSDTKMKMHDTNWDILIFSPLNDYSRGLYRHTKTGFLLPFDAFQIDWTDEKNWTTLPKHLTSLPLSFLKLLKEEFEFLGPITPQEFSKNMQWLLDTYKGKKIIFLNGAEVVFNSENYWEHNMHARHQQMNDVLTGLEKNNENVKIVDVRQFVKTPSDLKDNIRHYNKITYKYISDEIVKISKGWTKDINTKSELQLILDKVKAKVSNKLTKLLS
ncbi:MAG: HAD-IIIC family phosphatase [Bacteroidota bacterium]